jgi:hypothetical protein
MRIVELLKRVHGEETEQILNVSAEFMAYGNCLGPSPVMSLEGVYNAENGRMYLIGCQNVHAPRRWLLSMSKDLEDGMDCSIEVMVEYPPTTARWLISRPAKVFIASTRDDDDPLYFNITELYMRPVKYRQRRADKADGGGVPQHHRTVGHHLGCDKDFTVNFSAFMMGKWKLYYFAPKSISAQGSALKLNGSILTCTAVHEGNATAVSKATTNVEHFWFLRESVESPPKESGE